MSFDKKFCKYTDIDENNPEEVSKNWND
jgi:hypothetical protein